LVQEIPGKADIMPSLLISRIILILLQFNYLRRIILQKHPASRFGQPV
jgi:hypothetical protein